MKMVLKLGTLSWVFALALGYLGSQLASRADPTTVTMVAFVAWVVGMIVAGMCVYGTDVETQRPKPRGY